MNVKVGVKVSFVIPDGCTKQSECSEDMHRAFEACRQNLMDVNWIDNAQTLNVNELKKNNFIVFQSFEGETFEKVKNSQSVIIGPWCLLTCLSNGQPIPNVSWPIFNMAMANCYVTCSHFPKVIKEDVKMKVQSMGGHYTDSIFQVNTHLVTDSVKSEKYLKAATSGIKIMLLKWVDSVWNASLKSNITCDDKEFDVYRCLPLQNLIICTTGFTILEERKKLEELIKKHGGIYSGQMHLNKTDVLVCNGSNMSEKLKAAKKSRNVKCVTLNWITDSIEKGYALPDTDYAIQRGTSTPTKQDEFINPNFSTISAIGNATHIAGGRSILQETINMTNIPSETETKKRKSGSLDELNELMDRIDLKRVKRAGSFLDGCSIYLAGFGNEQREKICKILNFSGATRYEGLSDRLTHIIVGDTSTHELKSIQSKGLQIPIVTVHWLYDCVEQEKVVPDEKYLVNISSTECGSPLSQKGLQLLRNETSATIANSTEQENIPEVETDINRDIINQYLKPTSTEEDTLVQLLKDGTNPFDTKTKQPDEVKQQENTTSLTSYSLTVTEDDSTQLNQIFKNLKLIILNFDEEEESELRDCIEALGGKIVPKSYKGIPDYAIVPPFNTEVTHTVSEIVTDFWLTECWKENELRTIEYYHRPFTIRCSTILKGCVVTISGYTGTERAFLNNLVKELGGVFQEQFSRVTKNGILASTHLLSPVASGSKYTAALKWGRPVITKEWLFECAKLGKLVPTEGFGIEDVNASTKIDETLCQKSGRTNMSESQYENRETLPVVGSKLNIISESKNTSNKNNSPVNSKEADTFASPNRTADDTPSTSRNFKDFNEADFTPKSRLISAANDSSPNICSQVTPVNKIMNQVRSNYMLGTPPSTPPLPRRWGDVDTPETPLGAYIRPNPSPHLRKEMLKWINTFPESKPRRDSTPLSELKKRLWNKICPPRNSQIRQPDFNTTMPDDIDSPNELHNSDVSGIVQLNTSKKENTPETPENMMIQSKLLQLQEMLSSGSANRKSMKKRESAAPSEVELKNSQACTVGWDYAECHAEGSKEKRLPHFMLSGVSMEEREELVKQLQSLGATVSELNNYDPTSTHLISNRPSRNEKMLSSMAGGKWILHPDYIKKSLEIGKLADEEEFEYGNPKFSKNIPLQMDRETEIRANAIHWWRKEITKRGYGAFHDMRAIIASNKRESIVRVIEAGGGMVIDQKPPFTEEIYATHCLLDPKFVSNMIDYVPLAEQGIYIFNTLYINDFLHRNLKDVKDCILPVFLKYYD